MSIEFQLTEIVPAPPERVFQVLTDIDHAQWLPGLVSIERVGDVREGVGMRWRETRKMGRKEATEELEVTHYHPPSHFGVRIDGTKGSVGRGTFAFDYRLAQRVGGTEVRMTGKIDGLLPGWLRWLGPLLGRVIRRESGKDLRALAEHLRAPEHAAAAS